MRNDIPFDLAQDAVNLSKSKLEKDSLRET